MSLDAGIHSIPASKYHQDPSDQPSLSASVAKLLVGSTPLHAWAAHPRLNPNYVSEEKSSFDLGTVVHALILEGGTDRVEVIAAKDWRTKAAQELRDDARNRRRIPLLAKDWERVKAMTDAIWKQLANRTDDPPLFKTGKPEQALIWEEAGVTCRALVDWLHDDHRTIDDLKTTAASANPIHWSRKTLWTIGSDVQVAFYRRGVERLTGTAPDFRYVVVETTSPFALSVVSLEPSALELGQAKVDRAIERWRECLKTGVWPGYPQPIYYAEAPAYVEMQWLEQDGEAMAA